MSATDDECLGLSEIFDKYAPIFADKIGCCSQVVGIQANPDANLTVYPFRRLPIHLRSKIEEELKRNVKRKVLEQVDTAVCAVLAVEVMKRSGTIRICADFKPLNTFLSAVWHHIPHPADLFSILGGEKKFSKLDLMPRTSSELMTTVSLI